MQLAFPPVKSDEIDRVEKLVLEGFVCKLSNVVAPLHLFSKVFLKPASGCPCQETALMRLSLPWRFLMFPCHEILGMTVSDDDLRLDRF